MPFTLIFDCRFPCKSKTLEVRRRSFSRNIITLLHLSVSIIIISMTVAVEVVVIIITFPFKPKISFLTSFLVFSGLVSGTSWDQFLKNILNVCS